MIKAMAHAIEEATSRPAHPVGQQSVSGGSIHRTFFLRLKDGRRFFVKSNQHPMPHVFKREAEGLEALRAGAASVDFLRVP